MESPDRLLTVEDLAEYLGVPVATLYAWRYHRQGPPGFRVGRHLRYRWTDIEEWISHRVEASQDNRSASYRVRAD
ncbi:MAG: helix-turn-helix domain-containing protein [Actinomycetia bacterium]|nr:helix-turn-helix domain-containing protein [Actinomycetes bacterium]